MIKSFVARGEPVKSGRGPTFSKTSSTPGSRQDDDRPRLVSPIPHRRATHDTETLACRSPIQNIVDTVTDKILSTVTGEMQSARQDQQQMFSAMIESQRQLVSTILSAQSKEVVPTPPPDLNKMGLEELLKLMTETEDGEEYMKIQQVFSVRLKALGAQKKREGNRNHKLLPLSLSPHRHQIIRPLAEKHFLTTEGEAETVRRYEERCLNN